MARVGPIGSGNAGAERRDQSETLLPYLPRLVVDWLAQPALEAYKVIAGTCVFADLSGFTSLTERLAKRGRAGAEEMGDLVNVLFEQLLAAAYDYGANLVKWGGDAVLLLFDGEQHAERACRAAWMMQEVLQRIGRLQTTQGTVRIGMSIGIHTGEFDFALVGNRHRELVVTGPAVTSTARMEKIASRGQVMVSPTAAAAIADRCTVQASPESYRLVRPPIVDLRPNRILKRTGVDLSDAFCSQLYEHLVSGIVEYEHRHVAIGFVEFSGTDGCYRDHGRVAMADAVEAVITAAQESAADNDVTFLATDICENGGKVILVSGAPRSAGDDEARVLSTLKRVVHAGGRLSLRAGVSSGAVFSGDYGPHYRRVYSVTGDIVNLAARLVVAAKPGQVIASPEVIANSRTRFRTTALPALKLKGKREPVEALLVGDVIPTSAPLSEKPLPLIGRNEELDVLIKAANAAANGAGQVVDVAGLPGMGKSRLVEELVERCGSRVLWADGDIYETATPYFPVRKLFRSALGLPLDADDGLVASVLFELVQGTAPDLRPWLPLIGIVVGVEFGETPEIESLDPVMRKARLEAVTSEVFQRLLTEPIVLVFNDVHFMDDATLSLLNRMAADVANCPWLVVVTRRADFDSPLTPADTVKTIRLEPLDDAAAGRLLALVTDARPLPGHRLQQIAARSGGNPLFLLELTAGVTQGSTIDEMPGTIEAVIAARIDRLGPGHRQWLRAASVLGQSVDPTLLADLLAESGIDQFPLGALGEFISAAIDGSIRFKHGLIRVAAYDGLPFRRRTELHAIVARLLQRRRGQRTTQDEALLSLHCSRGGLHKDAWKYSRLAGDRARRQYALSDAVDCYRRALDAVVHLTDRNESELAEVYEALADVHADLGEMALADVALLHARRASKDDVRRVARLRLKVAIYRQRSGKYGDALRWLSAARKLLNGANDAEAESLRADCATIYAVVKYRQGNYTASSKWAGRALEEALRSGNDRSRAGALEMLALSAATAGWPWKEADFLTALDLYEKVGDLRAQATCFNRFGCACYFSGRWSEAVELFASAEASYRRMGREEDEAVNGANQAEILIDQGRVDEALPVLTSTIRVCRSVGASSSLAFCLGLLGRAQMTEGDLEAAALTLKQGRELSDSLGERVDVQRLDLYLAECALKKGNARAALAAIDSVLDRDGRLTESSPNAALFHRVKGEALILSRKRDEGHSELRAALVAARQRDARLEIAIILRALLQSGAAATEHEAQAWATERTSLELTLGLVEGQPLEPAAVG